MCGLGGDALAHLLEAVQAYVGRAPETPTPAALGERLIRLRHGIDLLELGFAADAAVFAGSDDYETQGSTSAIDWLRHHCQMSGHASARAVVAGELCPRLPESVAALEDGRIGFAHFPMVCKTQPDGQPRPYLVHPLRAAGVRSAPAERACSSASRDDFRNRRPRDPALGRGRTEPVVAPAPRTSRRLPCLDLNESRRFDVPGTLVARPSFAKPMVTARR